MKNEELYEVIGEIDEKYIKDAHSTVKMKSYLVWIKRGAVAACLCLAIGLAILIKMNKQNADDVAGTLMGASEIYPTVMVNGNLYEWRRGRAICSDVPSDSIYYGDIIHVGGQIPAKDCEFVSAFTVSGQIYTISGKSDCVYLRLSTDWMNDKIVVFDIIEYDSN